MKTIIQVAISVIILILLTSLIMPTDDSDFSKWKRSGLRIHVDAKTGVQYMSTFFGGPTPRLNADGSLMIQKGK